MSMAMATITFQPRLMYSSSYPMSKVCSSSTTMHGRRLSYNCCCCFSRIVLAVDFVRDGGPEYSRKEVLRRVDFELARNNEREAVSLVMSLQGKPGGLRGFGVANQVINGGGVEALLVDTIGQVLSQKYRNRVVQHEAGHFLIAYLLGVLPKGYALSSLEAFKKEGSLNVQAGTTFVDFQFLEEVKSGKISSQLENLLRSLSFTQQKTDSQVRWAVLNTVTLLRRHKQVQSKLVEAMSFRKPVGECIDVIEDELMNVANI